MWFAHRVSLLTIHLFRTVTTNGYRLGNYRQVLQHSMAGVVTLRSACAHHRLSTHPTCCSPTARRNCSIPHTCQSPFFAVPWLQRSYSGKMRSRLPENGPNNLGTYRLPEPLQVRGQGHPHLCEMSVYWRTPPSGSCPGLDAAAEA